MNELTTKRLQNILADGTDNLLIMTHKNCMDGTGSVLAIADVMNVMPSKLNVHFCQYGEDFSDIISSNHENVLMCDFSLKKEELLMLDDNCENLVVIDHHKTAEDALQELPFAHFDMNESGATLTSYCLQRAQGEAIPHIPQLLEYIKDRDLWNWNLTNSKAVSAGLSIVDNKNIDNYMMYMKNIRPLLSAGIAILDYQNQMTKRATHAYKMKKPARFVKYNGVPIPFINATHLISEIGNEISKTYPFAIMFFFVHDSIVLSMRSNDDNPEVVDVSKITKEFGGGGHPRAAGCSFKLDEHPGIFDQLFVEQVLK